jgi:chemotaxis family two-component system response regulator Rcp1
MGLDYLQPEHKARRESGCSEFKRILVVEDNFGDRMLINEVFGHLPTVRWHYVTTILQAGDFLQQLKPFQASPRPDMVLLDLSLPIFPGYSLIQSIKSDPRFCSIRVVVFTSSESFADRTYCTALGADDYIIKPIDHDEWRAALGKIIS